MSDSDSNLCQHCFGDLVKCRNTRRHHREDHAVQSKAGSDLVRRQNRSVVIAALRRNAVMSRTELTAKTGSVSVHGFCNLR